MVSFVWFFVVLFLLSVFSVASIGLILDELSFLWLAALNFLVLIFSWLVYLFLKPIKKSDQEPSVNEEPVESSKAEKPSKSVGHTHYHNFVKYGSSAAKKKRKVGPLLVFGLLVFVCLAVLVANWGDDEVVVPSSSLTGYSQSILTAQDVTGNTTSGVVVVESTGEVLSTGFSQTTGVSVNSSFVAQPEIASGSQPVEKKVEVSYSPTTLKFKSGQSVSLLEAVIYLLQTRDIQLNTSKDLVFNGVSKTNPYYKYWYTATKLGLVGPTSVPTTLISCQTYIVLKGMVEKRNVQYTSANVKTQYWAEAQHKDVLNGCVFGKLLKGANLD